MSISPNTSIHTNDLLSFQAVQQVISNLLVSNIELRSEDSIDIKPYTHQRQVEKIVVKLGDELEFFKTKFLRVRMLRKLGGGGFMVNHC